jgi:hypothetical protein
MARLARIVAAYLIASIVAGFVLVVWERLPLHGYDLGQFDFYRMLEEIEIFAVGFSVMALAPSLFLIALAEAKRFGVWQAYGLAGALIGPFVFAVVYWLTYGGPTRPPPLSILPGAFLAGGLAGLTYWIVAGCTARTWRPSEDEA